MEYLNIFETENDYSGYSGNSLASFVNSTSAVHGDMSQNPNNYLTVVTSGEDGTYYCDEIRESEISHEIVVSLTYSGITGVRADLVPIGWTETLNDGKYSYKFYLTSSVRKLHPIIFTHTHDGIVSRGVNDRKEIRVVYPSWVGLSENSGVTSVSGFDRFTSAIQIVKSFDNDSETEDKYLVCLTKGNYDIQQIGCKFMEEVSESYTFTSPLGVVMDGYKLILSKNKIGCGNSLSDIHISIN